MILSDLETTFKTGFSTLQLQKSPHIVIISKSFYEYVVDLYYAFYFLSCCICSSNMKPILARWMLPWLRARKLTKVADEDVVLYLLHGNNADSSVSAKVHTLGDDHVKMLNLSHDWLQSFLPFVLQKINRVHFGLLHKCDIDMLVADGVKIPASRKLTAVPFVAKDVPSRASEFAHPDVLIGLTILAYRYEGLRPSDFHVMLRYLRDCLETEGGAYKDRPSCQRFEV